MPDEFKNQIVTGDARALAERIPAESIDLIFTDPVYDRIDDYRWLAETAARVLKPFGMLCVWSNGKWHYPNTKWLEASGLQWRWTFDDINLDRSAPMNGKIIAKANRVIWMDRDGASRLLDYLPDGYASYSSLTTLPRLDFGWHKSPIYCGKVISAFTFIGNIIADFFSGSGTIAAMAKQLKRNFIAFEIDPATAERARERVQNTQPPLFVLQPEQAEMTL
jgi:hypothetical protein